MSAGVTETLPKQWPMPLRTARVLAAALALGLAAPAYAATQPHAGPAAPAKATWVPLASDGWAGHRADPTNVRGCDPIDPAQCLLRFPNDWFTKPDPTSVTGRRLDLPSLAMPTNTAGKPIDPAEWNRSDGFSAGSQILTLVPGMTSNRDLAPSKLPPVTDLAQTNDPDSGVVLLDTATGRRWPVWAELDQYTDEAGVTRVGPVQHDLMIHPSVNLTDGHHYIVALRHLVGDDGKQVPAPKAFVGYRDGTTKDGRSVHMNTLFATLAQAGIARKDLYLAWDFTTASTKGVTGRLLAIRDDAFAQLGETSPADLAAGKVVGNAPAFTVDSVADYTPAQDARVARHIEGHFTVPCYIAPTCDPPVKCDKVTQGTFHDCPTPTRFALGPSPDAVPHQTGTTTYQSRFICNVGRAGFTAHQRLRPVEYGHGLFGSAREVNSDPQKTMANRFSMMYCATDWFGMASADVPNAILALTDLSNFPVLTDRVQQGELNFTYLARLMVHPQGFAANPAFQYSDRSTFINTTAAYYDGNSQGGIFGGTVCAISIDVRRCTLGVSGMNYSVLLPRSSDFVAKQSLTQTDLTKFKPTDPTASVGYSSIFDAGYPQQAQRMLILDLIQILWDRSDPDGYATHMTGGLPNTPTHKVLMQIGYGDHQVANITAETEARTIGARAVGTAVVEKRLGPYVDPFWGLAKIKRYPYDGSAIAIFDSGPASHTTSEKHKGTDPPPTADVPNRSGDDPHEAPRRAKCAQGMKNAFLRPQGTVIATPCGNQPYFSWSWDGQAGL